MVAYSFHRRFVSAIEAGYKRQTIRAARQRHAKPGELIQLYQGMRGPDCRKIIPDPRCERVETIRLFFDGRGMLHAADTPTRALSDMDAFAILDGFIDVEDMTALWADIHAIEGKPTIWTGVLIEWEPLAVAPARVAA